MNKQAFEIKRFITETCCDNCDVAEVGACKGCYVKEVLQMIDNLAQENLVNPEQSNGCPVCRDKRGRKRSFFIMDESNRTITDISFCPVCGSKM